MVTITIFNYIGIIQPQPSHKEEDDKQQHAEVKDAREDDDDNKDNEIAQSIFRSYFYNATVLQCCNYNALASSHSVL